MTRALVCVIAGLLVTLGGFLLTPDVQGATHGEGYKKMLTETSPKQFIIGGQSAAGSQATLRQTDAADKTPKLEVNYRFRTAGWIEVHWPHPPLVDAEPDQWIDISLWVTGSDAGHFHRAALRFIDATGQVFEYTAPGLEVILNQGERSLWHTRLNYSHYTGFWGGRNDGILHGPVSFLGLTASYGGPRPAEGTFIIDGAEAGHGATSNLHLTLTAKDDAIVVPLGNNIEFAANLFLSPWTMEGQRIVPAQTRSIDGVLRWYALNWAHRVIQQKEQPLTINDGDRLTVPITIEHAQPGIVQLVLQVVTADGAVATTESARVAVFETESKPLAQSPMFVGVAANVQRYDTSHRQRLIDLAQQTGFAGVRFDLEWNRVQPQPQRYEWHTYDSIFDQLQQSNMLPLPLLAYSTPWASTVNNVGEVEWADWHFAPPQNAPFVAFSKAAVKRYGDFTDHWEVWNEPDQLQFWRGDATDYANLFDVAYEAIHDVQPGAYVANGGFSESKQRPEFIVDYLKVSKTKPDIFAFHSHGPLGNLHQAAHDVESYFDAVQWHPKRLWLNEAGFSSSGHATELQQAVELVKKIAFAAAKGYDGYVWYDLQNDGVDPNDNEHHFGLVHTDFTPKLALVAANAVMRQIGGQYVTAAWNDPADPVEAYAFQSENTTYQSIVLWHNASRRDRYVIQTDASRVTVVNFLGEEIGRWDADGPLWNVPIVVSELPQWVLLHGATDAPVLRPFNDDTP